MKSLNSLSVLMDPRMVRILITIGTLVMFILAGGAPGAAGDISG